MISFDQSRDAFVYEGAIIGKGAKAAELAAQLPCTLKDFPGQPGWQQLEVRDRPLNLAATFRDGLLHSGYFWAKVASGGSWDDLEPTEAKRRAEHEAIMRKLFGALHYDGRDLKVYLVRDPRDSMERMMFEIL